MNTSVCGWEHSETVHLFSVSNLCPNVVQFMLEDKQKCLWVSDGLNLYERKWGRLIKQRNNMIMTFCYLLQTVLVPTIIKLVKNNVSVNQALDSSSSKITQVSSQWLHHRKRPYTWCFSSSGIQCFLLQYIVKADISHCTLCVVHLIMTCF